MSGEEYLVEQIKESLYESDEPLSLATVVNETDAENRYEAKSALREMIERGMISTTPRWKYRLSTRTKRSLDTGTDHSGGDAE